MKTIPISILESRFNYDPKTGLLTWLNGQRAGFEAGCLIKNKAGNWYRYLSIGYNGTTQNFLVHRVIYALFHKEWVEEVDHFDGNGLNNEISNLRPASRTLNNKNHKRQSNNSSGLAGVSWTKRLNKYRVYGTIARIQHNLGLTNDFFEACCIRKKWELNHNYTGRHGK